MSTDNANSTNKYQKRIITVPNMLSFFRLCLIPLIIWLYCFKKDGLWTTLMLALSGITDIADGIIARKFNMVSDFGKALDPVADKLTQIAMLICLLTGFPHMLYPLLLLVIKETTAAITNMILIKKTGVVLSAVWHGKANTVLLYSMMIVHLIWYNIPSAVSDILIFCCTAMIITSGILYGIRNIRTLKNLKKK